MNRMPRHIASLRTLFSSHKGNVSDKWSIYLDEYSRLFAPYRNMPVQLLEIGIQNGGSLEIWAEYFRNAKKLVGCDVDPACAQIRFATTKIEVVVGDANAPETVSKIRSIANQYHLVIDDGSHKSDDIIKSFSNYFDMVREGGLYVAEDLHCSYWSEYGGGLYDPVSSVMFFKALADIVNQEHWGIERPRNSVLEGFHSCYGVHFNEEVLSQVHSVEFVNSICVVRKAPAVQNGLGDRCITGLTASVVPAVLGLGKERFSLDQSGNPWTARKVSVAEELESTTVELRRLRATGEVLSAEVDRLRQVDEELKAHEQRERALFEQLEQLRGRHEALLLEALSVAQAHALRLEDVRETGRALADDAARHHLEQTRLLQDEIRIRQGGLDEFFKSRILREEEFADKLLQLQQAATEREARQLQSHAQREQRLLTDVAHANTRADAYVRQMAEIQKSFVVQLERIGQQHRTEMQTRLLEHQELVRNFEAVICRKDQDLLERDQVARSYRSLTAELRGELQSVYASLPWRWSAPFRKAWAAVGGRN